jgi:molybdate transport system substrate-binding protein
LLSAPTIGYSTGPSGTHLLAVLKSWGLDAAAEPGRLVQAKPGIPVATLVASGEAAIGIQQLSELLGQAGLDVVGTLPPPVQSVTTFAMGIGARSTQVEEARAVIAYLNASEAVETKRRFGMEPA